jgi:FtsZ-binding cell division protein ZapB
MNADIIGNMSRAEGYMIALANIAADREICGDNSQSFLMVTANQMSVKIREAINYITKLEGEIGKLKEELSEMRMRHPDELQKWVDDKNTEAVISAGR